MAVGFTGRQTRPPDSRPDPDEALARLRLIRSARIGPVGFHRLIAEHGSARAVLEALPAIAAAAGARDYQPCPEGVARAEFASGRRAGMRVLFHGSADYPPALAQIADAPALLWARGDIALLARPMVALVGARNASALGLRMTRRLAEGIAAAGPVVVSGLARGIDTAAHEASLVAGTIAVMAGGADVAYPEENLALMERIAAQGLILSEHPPGLRPQARHFPARNRIVSGLSRAVLVVEAAARSGSLITARLALEQGREVLAVPGHPFDPRAAGCNQLLRDGAGLIRGSADVLEALGLPAASIPAHREAPPEHPPIPGPSPAPPRSLRDTAGLHQQILDRLAPTPLAEDQLVRDLAMPPSLLAPELMSLELEGRIRRQPGGLLSLGQQG